MEQEEQKLNSLPENAYRELKPGEKYKPMMHLPYKINAGAA